MKKINQNASQEVNYYYLTEYTTYTPLNPQENKPSGTFHLSSEKKETNEEF